MNLSKSKWAALSLLLLASCGDKDKEEIENPEGPQGSGSMTEMTPAESKEYLQNTATEFLNLFNPQDQKQAIELAAYFSSEYADYDAPDEFELEPDGKGRTPAAYIKAIGDAAKGDLDALTRAATSYSYTIKFDKFAGIYEPNSRYEQWVKTGNSKDIVFRFYDRNGQTAELKISQSGGASDVDFSVMDWDYDYDYSTGYWEEFEIKYNYFLSIPKNVTAVLTDNGKELANSTVISSIDIKGHKISADVTAKLMNVNMTAKVEGNDSKVAAQADFFVDGKRVGDTYATVNGSNLCNVDKYESFEDMDDDEIEAELTKMFKNGDCGANVLDKVQVYGQIDYYRQMPEDLDGYWDGYDYSKESAREACQKSCDRLNKNIKAQLRYDKTATNQATLQFAPYFDKWGSSDYSWEYYVSANLLFPDDTTYNIESYFERFTNVANKWEALLNAYERLWDTALRK